MSDEKEISSSDKLIEILDNYLYSLSNTSAANKSNELEIGFGGEGKIIIYQKLLLIMLLIN